LRTAGKVDTARVATAAPKQAEASGRTVASDLDLAVVAK
jgi:hypothetical protein